jgi:hypothetical protein
LGFDDLRDMYREDPDFKEAYEAAENPILRDRSQWTEYMIQEGLKVINFVFQNAP